MYLVLFHLDLSQPFLSQSVSVFLCDSFHEMIQREERGRKECMGNETEKVSVRTSVLEGVCFCRKGLVGFWF